MAEGINVGSVEVSVVPDARQFNPLLQSQVGPAADEAARKISDAISRGIRDGLTDPASTAPAREQGSRAGDSFGTAFKTRVKAALSALPSAEVKLEDEAAQAKLDYLREELTSLSGQKVGVDISDTEAIARLTALRAEMDNLAARSASVQVNVDTAAASAQLDKFFAETTVKAKATGNEVGNDLTDEAAKSAGAGSPLIVSAVAAALIAGGPAISAAGIVAFGGLAAVVAAQVPEVKAAFSALKTDVMGQMSVIGQEIAPTFEGIAADAQQAFNRVEPAIHDALVGVAPELQVLAQGFETAAETAIPAFTRAIQGGQPIIAGLSTLVQDIGSGIAGLMDALTAHSGAEGSVLSGIGTALGTLLPMVGTLLGEGAELGATVLPPINFALGVFSGILNAIGPVLPVIVAGFLGFKAVSALSGPLDTLSTKLQAVADGGGKLTTAVAGNAAAGVSKLSNALPAVSVGLGILGAAFEADQKQVSTWAQALLDGGKAAETANQQMAAQTQFVQSNTSGWKGLGNDLLGVGNGYRIAGTEQDRATKSSKDMYNAMTPLQQKQQDVTKAYNELQDAVGKYGDKSGQAAGAAVEYRDKQQALAAMQDVLTTATNGTNGAVQLNATRLQNVANTASGATSQINLLKGALDALTGQQVSMVQAQDAVIQATDAAVASAKNQTGALVENNDVMGTNTARAAASREALIQVANSSNTLISTMEQQGKTSDEVNAKDAQLRGSFIQTAEKMGYSAGQAENLANQIYGIPSQRKTEIDADTDVAAKRLRDLQTDIDNMRGKNIQITVSGQGGLATYTTDQRNLLYGGPAVPGKADGGPISGPGTGTSDTAGLFALSNGEHVWTAKEVSAAGGHAGVEALRQAVLAGGGGRADGGPIGVNVNIDETRVDSAINALEKQMAAAASAVGGPPTDPLGNVALGLQLATARGWGGMAEWTSLYKLWQRESGWRNTAQNPTSTAYGIPQFLDGTWASVGAHKTSDAAAQINAGLTYIAQRFHDPIGAWAHETQFGWYDQGGLLPTGPSLVYNGTGSPELIAPRQTFEQVMSGASGGGGGPASFTGNLYLDSGEFLGVVRGHAEDVTAAALTAVTNRGAYNG